MSKRLDSRLEALLPGGKTVIELGCGSGYALDALSRSYEEAVGLDISEQRLGRGHINERRWRFIKANLNEIFPLDDDHADAVLATQVIEHIADPRFFANEIFRVLRPGGIAVLATPNIRYLKHLWQILGRGIGPRTGNSETLDGAWDNGHIHYFTHRDLLDLFRECGFSKVKSRALVEPQGKFRLLRLSLDRLSHTFVVRELLTGNALVVAVKPE